MSQAGLEEMWRIRAKRAIPMWYGLAEITAI
jgi:hypothetical protein